MSKRDSNATGDSGGTESGDHESIDHDSGIIPIPDDNHGNGSTASFSFTDPAPAGNVGNSESGSGDNGRKKRGRPKGSGNKQTSAQRDIGVEGVANLLLMVHSFLANLAPELEIDEGESVILARASTNVMRHYDIKQSDKALAWTGLIMACGKIYGQRAFAIRTRIVMDKKERKPSNIVRGSFQQPGVPLQ